MKILVRYHDGAVPLTILPQGDWIDLCAAETVTMHAGEFRIISLGVSMQLPEGYEAHIVPRSSTFRKWGILQANSMGVIACYDICHVSVCVKGNYTGAQCRGKG